MCTKVTKNTETAKKTGGKHTKNKKNLAMQIGCTPMLYLCRLKPDI